jgi:ATP-dependent helicase HrpA
VGAALRLFKTPDEALAGTRVGAERLLELALRYELAWLQKDLRALRELGPLTATLAPIDLLQADAYACICRWVCASERVGQFGDKGMEGGSRGEREADGVLCAQGAFEAAVVRAKEDLRGLVPRLVDLLREILTLRTELQVVAKPYAGLWRWCRQIFSELLRMHNSSTFRGIYGR